MVTGPQYEKDGVYFGAETIYGLSTDTKPSDVGNGSIFIAVDKIGSTDTVAFMFDAENATWYPEETPSEDTPSENTPSDDT